MNRTVYFYSIIIVIVALWIGACRQGRTGGEWLQDTTFDKSFIQEGEGKDDIPAIDEPNFSSIEAVDFLTDSSLVLGISVEGVERAYPLNILQWHEIVNDQIGNAPVAITYATLTGSGIAFERLSNNNVVFNFGVSGLLYKSNLIAFDRLSGSNWLQFQRRAVNGLRNGQTLQEVPIIEMKWRTWRLLFPNSQVLNTDTGFNRPYQSYPYGDYRTNDTKLLFPLDSLSNIISFKEKGLGVIIGADAKFYPLTAFSTEGISIIEDEFRGEPLLLIGSQTDGLIAAYHRKRTDGSIGTFEVADATSFLIKDEKGTLYNVFGKTITGIATENLSTVKSNMGYWFAWTAFYPLIELYE